MNENPLFDQPGNANAGNNGHGAENRQIVNDRLRFPYRGEEYGNEAPLIDSYIPQIPQGYNAIGR